MISTKVKHWEYLEIENLLLYAIGGDWGKELSRVNEKDYVKVLCIRGSDFKNWNTDNGKSAVLRAIKKNSLLKRKLIEGDILLEISGGGPEQPVGRTVLITKQTLSFQKEIHKVPTNFLRLLRFTNYLNKSFVNLFLKYFYYSGEVIKYQAGSNNLRNLKFDDYKKILIPLPPLNEQKRLVAKIEELFSELDNAVAGLKKAQEQLKIYRQALLKNAFEGKLTEQWRKINVNVETPNWGVSTNNTTKTKNIPSAERLLEQIKQERKKRYEQELAEWKEAVKKWEVEGKKDKKPTKPKALKEITPLTKKELDELPKLPNEWMWVKIGSICETNPKIKSKDKIDADLEVQFVPMKLVEELTNKIHLDEIRRFSEVQQKSYTYFSNDDIIFAKVTPCMENGKIAIAKNLRNNIGYGSSEFHVIRCSKLINNKIILYYLIQDTFRNKAERAMTGAVGLRRVPISFIENSAIPLFTLEEQNEIVRILDEQFSVIDKLEAEIENGLKKAELLRQSILKKAFEGKLVPQDPNDEPASELLKRIKKEKEKYLSKQK